MWSSLTSKLHAAPFSLAAGLTGVHQHVPGVHQHVPEQPAFFQPKELFLGLKTYLLTTFSDYVCLGMSLLSLVLKDTFPLFLVDSILTLRSNTLCPSHHILLLLGFCCVR